MGAQAWWEAVRLSLIVGEHGFSAEIVLANTQVK
jgi:hypothetical protein